MPKKKGALPSDLGGRLKKIRKMLGLTQVDLSELCQVSQSVISSAERGEQAPPVEVYFGLACKYPTIDIRELLCGTPYKAEARLDAFDVASQVRPIIRAVGAPIDDLPEESVADDYLAVPLLDGKVAAGPGGVVWEQVKSLVWLYKPQLRGKTKLVAVRVGGDSMVPTIPPGSIVIVDRAQWMPNGGRKNIWALRTEDGDTQIKRLHIVKKKKATHLIVMSDNFTEYPPEPAWTGDMKELVIGKVIWMWQSLE